MVKRLEIVKTLADLDKQIRSAPDSTELYVYAAYQYLLLNQPDISDSLIMKAYSLDPNNPLVQKLLKKPENGAI